MTLRERDSMQQERVPVDKVEEIVNKKVNMKSLLLG
ncbi:MAG TPA: hypothetical protein PKE17_01165 [Saprospiraceae bacterium]|nr:hypothetical protein [Saprospiraceae bacterium]